MYSSNNTLVQPFQDYINTIRNDSNSTSNKSILINKRDTLDDQLNRYIQLKYYLSVLKFDYERNSLDSENSSPERG